MRTINTENAPKAIGPYSQAIVAGNMLFCSGQIAIKPTTGELDLTDIQSETRQVLRNLFSVVTAANFEPKDIVKTTIFLSDMNIYGEVNDVYAEFFNEILPAREAVAVKTLPKNVNVEISCIAVKNQPL
jgi:2-iminobutanoate/2-iminopropanoate deaminase